MRRDMREIPSAKGGNMAIPFQFAVSSHKIRIAYSRVDFKFQISDWIACFFTREQIYFRMPDVFRLIIGLKIAGRNLVLSFWLGVREANK